MKKSFLSSAVLLVSFLTFSVASAQGKKGEMVAVHGYGKGINSSCAQFLRETDEKGTDKALRRGDKLHYPENELYVQWVSGFLTGLSCGTDGQFSANNKNVHDLVTWIRKYCEQHPLANFTEATSALVNEIKK